MSSLRIGPDGQPCMPRILIVSAIFAMIAAMLMALTALFSAFSAGRLLRVIAWLTNDTDIRILEWAHGISAGLSRLILVCGALLGVAIAVFFGIYAWRILRGTGRARWIALAAVICGSIIALPIEPLLSALFLVASFISVVLAFLPAAHAWFAHRRELNDVRVRARGRG